MLGRGQELVRSSLGGQVRVRRARASEGTKEDGLPRMRIAIATKLERQKPNSKIKRRNVT